MMFVYAFFDGADDEPRYIGVTNKPRHRLNQHIREARAGKQSRKCAWLRSLGSHPRMQAFGPFPDRATAASMERSFITYYRQLGCRLTNVAAGGQGYDPGLTTRGAIAAAARSQMGDVGQRILRSEKTKAQWRDRGDEMRAALAARGETWRKASAEASRRRAAMTTECPKCGRALSGLGGAASAHAAVCGVVRPCQNCGEVATSRRCNGRCHNCSEYFRLKGVERPWSAQTSMKHGFIDEIV